MEADSKVSSKNRRCEGFTMMRINGKAGKPLQSESKLFSRKPL